jgi:hypothetical protein
MAKKHRVGIEIKTTADPKGARQVDDALEDVEDQAKRLRQELDKIDGLDPKVRAQIEGVAGSMERATVSGRKMAGSKDRLNKSTQNSGLAMLEFSRAVEDAQYGIRGVLNNVPQLISFMGGSAGLAGVISVAAVAMTQLVTAVMKADKELNKMVESLEVARGQLDDFYEETARDGTGAFRQHLSAVVDVLGEQNSALQENLRLTREKRQAELRIAAAGTDLEMANIAAAEVSGEMSAEEANAQRQAITVRRMRQEAETKILEAEEEYQLIADQQNDVQRRRNLTAEKIQTAEERRLELLNQLNDLQAREETAAKQREEGQKLIDDAGWPDLGGKRVKGSGMIERANMLFSEEDRQRMVEIQRVLLPQTESMVRQFKDLNQTLEQHQMDLFEAGGQAWQTREIVRETEPAVVDLREQTLEVENRTARQKEAIEEGNKLLTDVLKDNMVTVDEQRKLMEFVRRFEASFGEVTGGLMEGIRGLAMEAQVTQREVATLKENIRRLSANRGQ